MSQKVLWAPALGCQTNTCGRNEGEAEVPLLQKKTKIGIKVPVTLCFICIYTQYYIYVHIFVVAPFVMN